MTQPEMEVLKEYGKKDVDMTYGLYVHQMEARRIQIRNYWIGLAFNWFVMLMLLFILTIATPNPDTLRFWLLFGGAILNFLYGFIWLYHLGYRIVIYRRLQ